MVQLLPVASTVTETSAPLGVVAVTEDTMPLQLEPPPVVAPDPDPPLDPELPTDASPPFDPEAPEVEPPLDPDAPDDPELPPDVEPEPPPSMPALPVAPAWFPEPEPHDATPLTRPTAATSRDAAGASTVGDLNFMGSPPSVALCARGARRFKPACDARAHAPDSASVRCAELSAQCHDARSQQAGPTWQTMWPSGPQ
jgi:hypothetical protein